MGIFHNKKSLKVLFISTEAAPFAKIGGLGSVMYSLPKALVGLGYDARVLIPRYLSIDEELHHLKIEYRDLEVPTGNEEGLEYFTCNLKRCDPSPSSEAVVTTYFLENQEYYEQRANVYGYADDSVRWALLCRGTLEFIRQSNSWVPDVIVSSDWQTALVSNYLKTVYANDPVLAKIATVFSIHNLFYQAMYDHRFVSEMDFDDGHSTIPGFNSPRLAKLNWMRRGIMYSDSINTVSPNYAREIMTKDYGELLDELLRERKAVLSGILNGIDYDLWNPEDDPYIPFHYNKTDLLSRIKNKANLQERFGLPVTKDAFMVAIVSRFSEQKGLDLLFPIADLLIQELPVQIIVVGEGDSDMMNFFHGLETRYPDKVANHLKFDPILPHLVYAGSDVTIIPSRFEPCGLTQMEAMRMGCIPIVRKTGGLSDSVEDYNPDKQTGTGFTFEKLDSSSLMIAFIRAFENFRDKKKWQELQKRAMAKDFSWITSAKKYANLFVQAIGIHHKI
ncbi:MAG: glycogen/starch synthase [Patescibacteria group bacterium]|mgnify:CR=1 FL=1